MSDHVTLSHVIQWVQGKRKGDKTGQDRGVLIRKTRGRRYGREDRTGNSGVEEGWGGC